MRTHRDFDAYLPYLAARGESGDGIRVHATRVNVGRTYDGVIEGGLRVADDVERVVAEAALTSRPVRYLSVVGNAFFVFGDTQATLF